MATERNEESRGQCCHCHLWQAAQLFTMVRGDVSDPPNSRNETVTMTTQCNKSAVIVNFSPVLFYLSRLLEPCLEDI